MIDHLTTYATDYEATKAFYEAVLPKLGFELVKEFVVQHGEKPAHTCAFGPAGRPVLWIMERADKVTPRHFAFVAPSTEAVDAFHEAALNHGGEDNGAPGPRPMYSDSYYGAFAFDPDGNNVEAVCHVAAD